MDHIEEFHRLYGLSCWHLIYEADCLAREKQIERCRRRLHQLWRAGKPTGTHDTYEEKKPWGAAFEALTNDIAFWQKHVVAPCIVLMATNKAAANEQRSAAVVDNQQIVIHEPAPKKTGYAESVARGSDGNYQTNKKGLRFCPYSRRGECAKADYLGRCPYDPSYTHQCSICLQNSHGTDQHGSGKGAGGKKQKGEGKGGKDKGKVKKQWEKCGQAW